MTPFVTALGLVASAHDLFAMSGTSDAPRGILWSAPEACGSKSDFEKLLDEEGIELPIDWTVDVKIVQTDGAYVLAFAVQEPGFEGSRRLTHSDCGALLDTAVVLLSLAVSKTSEREGEKLGTAPEPPRNVPDVHRPAFTFAGKVGWGATMGPAPQIAHGPVVGAGLLQGHWALQLGAYGLFPSRGTLASGDAREAGSNDAAPQVELQTWGVWPEVCHAFTPSGALSGCLGVQLSRVSATGLGVTQRLTRYEPWIAPTLSLPVSIGARWRVLVTPAVTWAIVRPLYEIEPYGVAFQPAPWGAVLRLEAGWQAAQQKNP